MATTKELTEELRALKALLAAHGIAPTEAATQNVEDRADYIPHGSDKHARFLGLVPTEPDDKDHDHTYTSPESLKTYALEDEIMQFLHYANPGQAAKSTLRQKVNVLEGKPEVPADALPMWEPRDF